MEPRKVLGELVVIPRFLTLDQYNRLGNYLEEGVGYQRERDLLEFAYDWRQDVRISARQLGAAIESWQARSDAARGPITIIAHSLGTLVSRYFVEVLGGSARVERLVLLGGPHFGVPHIAGALAAGPQIPVFGGLSRKVREAILTFPSTFQFLPTYPCVQTSQGDTRCPLDTDGWLPPTSKRFLSEARNFRNELGTRFTVPTVCIFGYGMKTTSGISVQGDGSGEWNSVEWLTDLAGDGSVPKLSAVLPNTEIHPVKQAHGALYTDPDVRARLLLELTRERSLA
jgi:pimeloyl-ACP methyl ester carboxylesterase